MGFSLVKIRLVLEKLASWWVKHRWHLGSDGAEAEALIFLELDFDFSQFDQTVCHSASDGFAWQGFGSGGL